MTKQRATEHGLLMSGPMALAACRGIKTQTRRPIKPQPEKEHDGEPYWHVGGYRAWRHRGVTDTLRMGGAELVCPFGRIGDRIYVRETFRLRSQCQCIGEVPLDSCVCNPVVEYRAGGASLRRDAPDDWEQTDAWRPSIHMPKWAARTWGTITDVLVERVQSISEEDAKAEGVEPTCGHPERGAFFGTGTSYREGFAQTWANCYGGTHESFVANPWVWVVKWECDK